MVDVLWNIVNTGTVVLVAAIVVTEKSISCIIGFCIKTQQLCYGSGHRTLLYNDFNILWAS